MHCKNVRMPVHTKNDKRSHLCTFCLLCILSSAALNALALVSRLDSDRLSMFLTFINNKKVIQKYGSYSFSVNAAILLDLQ